MKLLSASMYWKYNSELAQGKLKKSTGGFGRALTEDEMAREIVNRRLRAAAKDSSASASNRVIE